LAQPLIVPGLRNAQFAYKETLETKLLPETRWLDIGCGAGYFLPGCRNPSNTDCNDGKVNATFGWTRTFQLEG